MKRVLCGILFTMLLLSLTACGSASAATNGPQESNIPIAAEQQDTEAQGREASVLVACFSRTGRTMPLAEHAAGLLGADLYEITAADPYTDEDINYHDSNSRTTHEQNDPSVRPAIADTVENMDSYDVILLAYPIWWGQAPRIISTFMESYDFSGKVIVPFCTSGSSDIGHSDDDLHALCADSAIWVDGKRLAPGAFEELDAWLAGLDILQPWLSHEQGVTPVVYFTSDISPEGLMAVYDALSWKPSGTTAVKVSPANHPPAITFARS